MMSSTRYIFLVFILIATVLTSCHPDASSQDTVPKPYQSDEFRAYWYAGNAEVNSYTLSQARYGENHDGHAVLIFVSEDFSKKKQVKLDNPDIPYKEKINVLKMNFVKKFVTGIYPYSMMLSTFTPINRAENPNTIKVTMSSQEWCGHVFTQMNLNQNHYNVESFSYFEKEGDEHFKLDHTLLEDELWNIIRLEPQRLPVGDIKIIPGLFFTRLSHREFETEEATALKEEQGNSFMYTVSIAKGERILAIEYEKAFPHKILGWTETYKDLNGELRKTTATLKKILITQYWKENKDEFRVLRDSLGIPMGHE